MAEAWSGSAFERNSFFSPAEESTASMLTTIQAYTAASVSAPNNYWGAAATADILAGGNPKNLTVIWDYYDNVETQRVDYSGWATTAFPMPKIDGPRWGHRYKLGRAITFTGHATDPEDGPLASNQLEWRDESLALVGTGPEISYAPSPAGWRRLWLYAYDSNGQMARIPVDVEIVP